MKTLFDLLLGPAEVPVTPADAARLIAESPPPQPGISISDPALARLFQLQGFDLGAMSEWKALGISAFYRGCAIIAGTIAGLPLKSYRDTADKGRQRVKSFLDNPAGPYALSPFSWKEMTVLHGLIHGEMLFMHVYNKAGVLIGLWPVHPGAIAKRGWKGAQKVFSLQQSDGTLDDYTTDRSVAPGKVVTHVLALSTNGLHPMAPLQLFEKALQTAAAGELSAFNSMTKGLTVAGLVAPEADMTEEDAKAVKAGLEAKVTGPENAGGIAVVNRAMKFTQWQQSNKDAQFLELREFQVVEIAARILGLPPHLVGATEKQTSWGSGVAEQNLGLARYTLKGWTDRIQEAVSPLLPAPRFAEFEYAALLQGTPQAEIELLIKQVEAGILTVDEARAIRNLPPIAQGAPA